jgi:hypothetical protein
MGLLRRVPLYLFPIYLSVTEYLVSDFLITEPTNTRITPLSVVGPSIVAAGIALLFPVIVPKSPSFPVTARVQAQLDQRNLAIYSIADQRVTFAGWITLVIMLGVWAATLYISHRTPPVEWRFVPVTLIMGAVSYIVGIFLTELKGIP